MAIHSRLHTSDRINTQPVHKNNYILVQIKFEAEFRSISRRCADEENQPINALRPLLGVQMMERLHRKNRSKLDKIPDQYNFGVYEAPP
jgi:hypothetical protein